MSGEGRELKGAEATGPIQNVLRTMDFWRRATGIYASYKGAQTRDWMMRQQGKDRATIEAEVPPMSPKQARESIQRELGVDDLGEVFEWIDLEKPLGSASVSQVHKAQLKRFPKSELKLVAKKRGHLQHTEHEVQEGDGAWDVCNMHGISMAELQKWNKGLNLTKVHEGQLLKVPRLASLNFLNSNGLKMKSPSPSDRKGKKSLVIGEGAAAAVINAIAAGEAPADGMVAVKIQYPNALPVMGLDLGNLRALGFYIGKTELKFDLVSAVDELDKQIRLEFDFIREARVMDSIASHLSGVAKRISVPRSVPGLVTPRLLVMSLLDGVPLTEAGRSMEGLSERTQKMGKRRILKRISEAYGRMIFGEGLFQADGHPGNILVRNGGNIGLLDYGQSKQLSDHHRVTYAKLVLALNKGDRAAIAKGLADLGVETGPTDLKTLADMSYSMFDTVGKLDPFGNENSDSKVTVAITNFPPDMFFIMRVVQLLRGMSSGMDIYNFSCVDQWAPFARDTMKKLDPSYNSGGGILKRLICLPLSLVPGLA
eukprot:gene27624-7261_t